MAPVLTVASVRTLLGRCSYGAWLPVNIAGAVVERAGRFPALFTGSLAPYEQRTREGDTDSARAWRAGLWSYAGLEAKLGS